MTEPKTAGKVTQPKPEPKPRQVTLTVPAGIDPEVFLKGLKAFEELKVKGAKVGKADGRALKALRDAHKEEFRGYRVREWKKEGLDPSNLK